MVAEATDQVGIVLVGPAVTSVLVPERQFLTSTARGCRHAPTARFCNGRRYGREFFGETLWTGSIDPARWARRRYFARLP